jgi:hypothetical protein
MSTYPIREFYPNGHIKYEYLRDSGGIRELRCWDENGDTIPERYIKYQNNDSDEDLVIRLKYICKKLPVPNFSRNQTPNSMFVVSGKNGPYYVGADF